MPPIRLYLDHSDPGHVFRFRWPDGTLGNLPGLRLKIYANLSALVRPGPTATHAAYPECILDTGAYLTIIPERVWRHFRPHVVTPLPFDTSLPQRLRDITLLGGTFPYRLAEVPVLLQDLSGGILSITLVAQLTHDGGRLTIPMVLGLRGGALDGRTLNAEPDASAPFGQSWRLGEP